MGSLVMGSPCANPKVKHVCWTSCLAKHNATCLHTHSDNREGVVYCNNYYTKIAHYNNSVNSQTVKQYLLSCSNLKVQCIYILPANSCSHLLTQNVFLLSNMLLAWNSLSEPP